RNAAGEAGEAPARFQDKYRLGRQIGVGTYGFVYDVQSRRAPQMKRAAKVIGITASEEAERRLKSLQREVDLWHRVSVAAGGQGVVQLFEVFVGHGFLAAVMEHCGPSLMDCAPEISRMKAAGVAHIFREMLKPIVFLHNLRIVHRDIKPENFLFCHQIDRSEVKLCDFGLATEMPTIGLRSGRYGTLPYMSPEMVGYSGHGFPTDLWSFGASAYYLLFNEFAYGFQKNGCPQTMAASIQSGQPQPRFFSLAQQIRTTSGQQAIGLLTSLLKHKSNDRVSAREADNCSAAEVGGRLFASEGYSSANLQMDSMFSGSSAKEPAFGWPERLPGREKECVDPQLQDAKSCEHGPCPARGQSGLSSRAREEKQAAAYGGTGRFSGVSAITGAGDICRDATEQDEASM
ncbi:unnamed protein product, partial [Effrenium voratum]